MLAACGSCAESVFSRSCFGLRLRLSGNTSCVLFVFTLPVFDIAELAKTLTTRFEFSWVRVCGILWDMCSGALPSERCCCEPVSRPRAVYQHQPSCPPCGADIQARRTTLDQSFSVAMENLTFFFLQNRYSHPSLEMTTTKV